MKDYKHFDGNDRIAIQIGLERGDSFRKIAAALGKHPTSLVNEVRKYRVFKKCGAQGEAFNGCAHMYICEKTNLCDSPQYTRKHCRYCTRCRDHCSEYEREKCARLGKPPYVCYKCKRRVNCTLEKAFYDASSANQSALHILSDSRSGINADGSDDIARWDATVSPLLKQGQSLYHIIQTAGHDASLPSQRTLYSYVEHGVLPGVCGIELPRQVKYKKRKTGRPKARAACRGTRAYADFFKFMEGHPDTAVVQMDSVVDAGGNTRYLRSTSPSPA